MSFFPSFQGIQTPKTVRAPNPYRKREREKEYKTIVGFYFGSIE